MDAQLSLFDDHGRLLQLLQTNYYPTPSEKSSLNDNVSMYEQESKQLEYTIAYLGAQLAELTTKKDLIDLKLRAAKGVYAPIRRISEEVLGEIFYWCSHISELSCNKSFGFWPRQTIYSMDATPFSLAQVCRRWRRIIFQIPKLFTQIYIPRTLSKDFPNPFTIVPTSLAHSGTLPLVVYIDPQQWSKTFDAEITLLFEKLRRHLHRITTLVTSAGPHVAVLFPEGTTTELPVLRRLEFVRKESTNPYRDIENLRVGQLVVEKLRILNLGNFLPRSNFLRFGENLRHFRVEDVGWLVPPSMLAEFFRQSHPNLEHLELYYEEEEGGNTHVDILSHPIYLPELTYFRLQWRCDEGLAQIISRLRTPKLKTLWIVPRVEGYPIMDNFLPALLKWLGSSKCDLHDLRIGFANPAIDQDDLRNLLELFSGLNRLVFEYGVFSIENISLLNRHDNPKILPKLRTLEFVESGVPQNETFKMIHSRASEIPGLPDVELLDGIHMPYIAFGDEEGGYVEGTAATNLFEDEFRNVYPNLKLAGQIS